MNIKIRKEDILAYVIGATQYDAIEKLIDPTRYEVFDCGIYDNSTKKLLKQSREYETYCSRVSLLRKGSKDMKPIDIKLVCSEIEQNSPTEINLES